VRAVSLDQAMRAATARSPASIGLDPELVQRLVDVLEATAIRREHFRIEALGAPANAWPPNLDRMAAIGNGSRIFVAVSMTAVLSVSTSADAPEELVDLRFQDGLQNFTDLLAAHRFERGQEIFAGRLGDRPRLGVYFLHGVSPVWCSDLGATLFSYPLPPEIGPASSGLRNVAIRMSEPKMPM